MKLPDWLNTPYPLITEPRDKWLIMAGFGLFTYLFLLVYEPFSTSEIETNRILFLSGFGLMVFTGLGINYLVLPALLPKVFHPDRWVIRKEIVYLLLSFILIGILNFTYNSTIGETLSPQLSLAQFIGKTVAIGIFPLLVMIFLTERYQARRNAYLAHRLNAGLKPPDNTPATLTLVKPETIKAPSFALDLDTFLFAESDNNYTTFYKRENGHVTKHLMRASIKNVTLQLRDIEDVVRCHRSYLINRRQIQNISGNARSLSVRLKHHNRPIPVSRSFSREKLIG